MKANFSPMNKILIDSHILLWIFENPEKLKPSDIQILKSSETNVFISIASLWELYIRASQGKLELPNNFFEEIEQNLISILSIRKKHLTTLLDLPHFHKDPFDRLIISQAIADNIPIITHNQIFSEYPVHLL